MAGAVPSVLPRRQPERGSLENYHPKYEETALLRRGLPGQYKPEEEKQASGSTEQTYETAHSFLSSTGQQELPQKLGKNSMLQGHRPQLLSTSSQVTPTKPQEAYTRAQDPGQNLYRIDKTQSLSAEEGPGRPVRVTSRTERSLHKGHQSTSPQHLSPPRPMRSEQSPADLERIKIRTQLEELRVRNWAQIRDDYKNAEYHPFGTRGQADPRHKGIPRNDYDRRPPMDMRWPLPRTKEQRELYKLAVEEDTGYPKEQRERAAARDAMIMGDGRFRRSIYAFTLAPVELAHEKQVVNQGDLRGRPYDESHASGVGDLSRSGWATIGRSMTSQASTSKRSSVGSTSEPSSNDWYADQKSFRRISTLGLLSTVMQHQSSILDTKLTNRD